jgi:sugar lactone lactonase YvrE
MEQCVPRRPAALDGIADPADGVKVEWHQVTPDGEARGVADDIEFPNGIVVTPDDSTLIISESFAGRLTAFDIEATVA